jgi:hypothetical protein
VANARGLALVVDSAFTGNTAGHHGGGIANKGRPLRIDTIFLDNSPDDVSERRPDRLARLAPGVSLAEAVRV